MAMSATEKEALRARLIAEQEELLRLDNASEISRQPVELDQTRIGRLSRLDALQQQEMAKETGRRRKVNLQRIEAALKRIEDGEFGFCIECGDKIAPKRLDLDPTAPLCMDCAGGARPPG